MTLATNKILCGHVIDKLKELPDESVNCGITSVPYWALRAYGTEPQVWGGDSDCEHSWQITPPRRSRSENDATTVKQQSMKGSYYNAEGGNICSLCGAWRGELGLEPTPELYIEHLMMVFDGVKRVLRKDGILFVNIADTYSGGKGQSGQGSSEYQAARQDVSITKPQSHIGGRGLTRPCDGQIGIQPKSLCAIPERFVLAMMAHGWIRRCTIIWAKGLSFCDYSGSCMPDSCKDRPNKNAFEYVYMFVKSKKYWYEQQYEDMAESNAERPRMGQGNQTKYRQKRTDLPEGDPRAIARLAYDLPVKANPLGRTIRNVWAINPQPYPDAHFATFPEKLVEPLIKMGTPEFVCKKCGKARVKIYDVDYQRAGGKGQEKYDTDNQSGGLDSGACTPQSMKHGRANKITTETGYTDCGCNVGFRPGVVLDPFWVAARPPQKPQDSEGTGLVLNYRGNISRWQIAA